MQDRHVVTVFLLHQTPDGDRILLLRRSDRVGTYQGLWAGVSGYLEGDPLTQAYAEVLEEAGLGAADVALLRRANIVEAPDEALGIRWLVHPFLMAIRDPSRIQLDWEHVEAVWIRPEEIGRYETVPKLAEALAAVYPYRSN